jgi:RHS repeat-associated protein
VTASFSYDALGRRRAKTVNGAATTFQYDGVDILRDSTATYLHGPGIDDVLSRTITSGNEYFLKDHLGSTIALTDPSGSLSTQYTYSAYGKATKTGSSTNYFTYTGREDDGTGLYFYRARYYSPDLKRFVAEDPIGFGGGQSNLYGYVGGNPISFTDPSGKVGGADDLAELGIGFVAGGAGTVISELADPCGARGLSLLGRALVGGAVGGVTTWAAANLGVLALPAAALLGGGGNVLTNSIGRDNPQAGFPSLQFPSPQQAAAEIVAGGGSNLLGGYLSNVAKVGLEGGLGALTGNQARKVADSVVGGILGAADGVVSSLGGSYPYEPSPPPKFCTPCPPR